MPEPITPKRIPLTESPIPSPPRAQRRALRLALTVGLVAATVGALGVYAARRALARDAVTSWLRAQGVESQITFQAFDPGGFTGALTVGPTQDPDLTAEAIEIRYDLLGFWTGDRFGARVTSVRLVRPKLKARWHGGRLSLGALDPLVETLRKRPADANSALPDIQLVDGRLRLDTDQGRLMAQADALTAGGRLQRLDLVFAPATLSTPDATLATGPAEMHLVTHGAQIAVALAARINQGQMRAPDGPGRIGPLDLRLSGQLPYPDLKGHRADGDLLLTLDGHAATASWGATMVQDLTQTLSFKGRVTGWGDGLGVTGAVTSATGAATARLGGTRLEAPSLTVQATEVAWTAKAGAQGQLRLTAAARRLDQGDLVLAKLGADLTGPARIEAGRLSLALSGPAATRGAWTGLGPARSGDSPGDAGLKRALASFALNAPAVTLSAGPQGLSLDLPRALTLRTDTGGTGQLNRLGSPLYAQGGGGFHLALAGGGLPQADLAISRYSLAGGAFAGQARLDAKGSLGPVVDAHVAASGTVRIADGALAITADRCADLAAGRLELGANDLSAISGQLCPTRGPLFQLGGGSWRAQGTTKALAAEVPFLQVAIRAASGPLDLASRHGDLALDADIQRASLADTAPDRRFNPLLAKGQARLAKAHWTGAFALSDASGRPLAQAALTHDGGAGAGGVTFDTGLLAFTPGGLQPAALSPKASMIGDPAQGAARFQGRIDWTSAGSTSGGTLDVGGLDFMSPAGAVSGLKGRIVFTSLAPLAAAPGQSLTADTVAALTPLTGAQVTFGLDHDAVQVSAAGFGLSGGQVRVEPFEIPFAGGTWRAAVTVKEVELADLVEASPFADRMDLKAKVSGRIPFAMTPQGVRIEGGELHAVSPGRISIRREALTGVQGAGGAPAVDPKAPVAAPAAAAAVTAVANADPYSDFVYQAMENLSFEALTAEVASRPGGRLGVIFHIKGEHDPPKRAEIKLTAREVLTRKILRTLPLPSGTKVDLTLDTSVNLDQLLGDLADYQRLRGSRPVQP